MVKAKTTEVMKQGAVPLWCALASGLLFLVGMGGDSAPAVAQTGTTNIGIDATVKQSGVKRFGINLSGQSYYDSGQMLRNLTFRNPGFEAETWQSIMVCHTVTASSCTDDNPWNQWPADFLKGAQFEFIYGAANGQTGTVTGMTPANVNANQGATVSFSGLSVHPAVGNYYVVRMMVPGNPQAGWWPSTSGGGTLAADTTDLSPKTPGKQALSMAASAAGQSAGVSSYFDTLPGRSFVQLSGRYTLSFRAKGVGGANRLDIGVVRLATSHGNAVYLQQTVSLTNQWQDYAYSFSAAEDGSYVGPVNVSFSVSGSSALLDDATLEEAPAPDNPTAFRNAVVTRLRDLHPGVLRYMDNGTDFGASLDNLLAVPAARLRSGFSQRSAEQDDIAIGLHEFMVLCKAVGAEPWFAMPAATSPAEMRNLIEYMGAGASTRYGKIRAALGQTTPWTSVFPVIHLELGNELWNSGSFPGEKMSDPIAYGTRTNTIFHAAKTAPYYNAAKFDLVMGGWAAVPWWNQQELSVAPNADTIDVAPYLFNSLADSSSNEAIFGPMFAQPELVDSTSGGYMAQQAKTASSAPRPVKLAVYEVNLSTVQGTAPQATLDAVAPSTGAGIAVLDHMLTMLRDDGVRTQNLFALPEYENGFSNTGNPGLNESVRLWGSVVDMGGQSNTSRPQFLAEKLANAALFGDLLQTVQTGANPTWRQPESANDGIALSNAHYLQSFAFTDGTHHSAVVFNLHRAKALPVTFSGSNAPVGTVQISTLTSTHITDTNEKGSVVGISSRTAVKFSSGTVTSLPAYSMTVFTW